MSAVNLIVDLLVLSSVLIILAIERRRDVFQVVGEIMLRHRQPI